MSPSWLGYLIVFLVAAVTTGVLTPVVRRIAVRAGAVVSPDARRVHKEPTPTLGGAAMLIGFLVAMVVAWQLDTFDSVFSATSEPLGVVIAAVAIWALGTYDDVREMSAPAKVAGMVIAGSLLSFFGISILVFRVPLLDVVVLSPDLSAVLTVVWVVGMVNAINLIDGLDGLASGIVAIGGAAFFLYSVELTNEGVLLPGNIGPLVAILAAGVCVGFLPHNFHPARIFMGDGGALLLGLLLAASTITVGGRASQPFTGQTFFFFAPIFIPLLILGVPIVDTVFAIVRRARSGVSVAEADKGHLHHRLMSLGHGQRRSVVILWIWTLLLSGIVLYPTYTREGDLIVVAVLVALVLVLYTVFHPGVRQKRRSSLAERDLPDEQASPRLRAIQGRGPREHLPQAGENRLD